MDIQRVEAIAAEQMSARQEWKEREPGWLFYHGMRTGKIGVRLADALNAEVDRDVVLAGGLFHDIGKGAEPHNLCGARLARGLLSGVCAPDELDQVCEIIELHNQRHESANHPMAVRLVQDADLIDHVGPVVPWSAFYHSGARGETIHDHIGFICGEGNDKFRKAMLFALNFECSVAIFEERVRWEDEFFAAFRKAYFDGAWHERGTRMDRDP